MFGKYAPRLWLPTEQADVRLEDGADGSESSDSGCYSLQHVTVRRPLEDGTLGLLLRGTCVTGFAEAEAEAVGWVVGDRIVEVAGCSVSSFESFLAQLRLAQETGYPITFSVLREEPARAPQGMAEATDSNAAESGHDAAKDALDSFFGQTSLTDLAGQLHHKFGATRQQFEYHRSSSSSSSTCPGDDGDSQPPSSRMSSIMANPYVQALHRRRDELFRSVEGWSSEVAASLASRLATERSDALASLVRPPRETPRTTPAKSGLLDMSAPLPWASCLPAGVRPCNAREAKACMACEITPTPRVNIDSEACRYLDEAMAWQSLEKLAKETYPDISRDRPLQNLGLRLLPNG
mmetsp:Transcript_74585/g.198140  ORF Transcript_74585/g.198140 Transcript_74585/m.198140 type:complete len:350 (-) Transcript_74585:141-1190(-)